MKSVGNEQDCNAAPRQPPYVLVAWIGDQLADVENSQVRRLQELGSRLQSDASAWDHTPLGQAIVAWHAVGRDLRFLDLKHSAIARVLGRHREGYARFLSARERIRDAAQAARQHLVELEPAQKRQDAHAKRVLIEIDMEWKALNGDVDQGVEWLQDLCTQLGEARTHGNDDPQLDSFAEAAQRYTLEFKRLQSLGALTREIAVRGHSVLQRRSALIEQVRADLDGFDKTWAPRVGALAEHVRALRGSLSDVTPAFEAHDELMKRLSATTDACAALQHEEHLLVQQVAMLRQELEGQA